MTFKQLSNTIHNENSFAYLRFELQEKQQRQEYEQENYYLASNTRYTSPSTSIFTDEPWVNDSDISGIY